MRHTFLVVTVKKWLKSVYIYGSYHKLNRGITFLDHRVCGYASYCYNCISRRLIWHMAVSERLATMHSRNGFWARARLAYFSASRQCSSTTRLKVIILLSFFCLLSVQTVDITTITNQYEHAVKSSNNNENN